MAKIKGGKALYAEFVSDTNARISFRIPISIQMIHDHLGKDVCVRKLMSGDLIYMQRKPRDNAKKNGLAEVLCNSPVYGDVILVHRDRQLPPEEL